MCLFYSHPGLETTRQPGGSSLSIVIWPARRAASSTRHNSEPECSSAAATARRLASARGAPDASRQISAPRKTVASPDGVPRHDGDRRGVQDLVARLEPTADRSGDVPEQCEGVVRPRAPIMMPSSRIAS